MRGGVVAAGVVLMILGAILFFEFPITSGNSGGNPFGDLFIGPVLAFIGFILLIAGLAASPTSAPTVVYQYPPTSSQKEPEDPNVWVQQRLAHHMGEDYPTPTQRAPAVTVSTSSYTSAPGPTPSSAVGNGTSGFCPFCGKPTRAGYKFCRSCGKELDG